MPQSRGLVVCGWKRALGGRLRPGCTTVTLEQQFAVWRSGELNAGELSDRIFAFSRGAARELWQRYNAGLDDLQVASAVVTGLLPRAELPAELLEALEPLIAFYEHERADSTQREG